MNEKQFQTFQQVLVRADGYNKWLASFYSHYDKEKNLHICTNGAICKECIPYEGNEHLLGTTDSPQPKRWRAEGKECYWYMGNNGVCYEIRDTRDKYDDARYNIGNYFRTKAEAEEMADRIKAMLKGGKE